MVPKNGAEERGCVFTVKKARIYVHVQLILVPKNGAEERGCVFTVKKARIYVHVQLQRNSSSTRVVNTRPWIFEISA